MTESVIEWSVRTWKDRHDRGYFPKSEEHKDWKIFDEVLPWLDAYLNEEVSVLEIGCGYGEWMVPMSRLVRTIDGVDIHQVLVHQAEAAFRRYAVHNARVQVSDGTTLPFADSVFDVVCSISVLQHLPRCIVHGYLSESFRVLKLGGTVLHLFRSSENVGPYPEPAKDIEVNHTGDFSVGWTREEISQAGLVAGFEEIDVLDLGVQQVLIGSKPDVSH